MFDCVWCDDINDFKSGAFNLSSGELYNSLKNYNYDYLVIDSRTVRKKSLNKTNQVLDGLLKDKGFVPVHESTGTIILKIV
jgi:hypothetical protein